MFKLLDTYTNVILLEQDQSKLMLLRKAINERIPITINYKGPSPEVLSGVRYDIEPIVLGNHFKSGNLVFWAYVFKGTSKKGIPNWKMFRVDRVDTIKFNLGIAPFELDNIPGYQKGKAPNLMKSLNPVHIFSPYWNKKWKKWDSEIIKRTPEPEKELKPTKTIPTPVQKDKYPIEKPEISTKKYDEEIFSMLQNKINNVDGVKTININDFETAVKNLYNKKVDEWISYQKIISGNVKPGEGTRKRFDSESRSELTNLLNKNNIKIENITNNLSETIKRLKKLITY